VTLEPGTTNMLIVVVDGSMPADRFGNTGVHVLATPMLVSYFELAPAPARDASARAWAGTVGSRIDIRHLAPTPIGIASPSGRGRHGQRPAPTWVDAPRWRLDHLNVGYGQNGH
jgi:hypothetical protein